MPSRVCHMAFNLNLVRKDSVTHFNQQKVLNMTASLGCTAKECPEFPTWHYYRDTKFLDIITQG